MVFFYIKGVLCRFFNIWNIKKSTIQFNINTPVYKKISLLIENTRIFNIFFSFQIVKKFSYRDKYPPEKKLPLISEKKYLHIKSLKNL